MKISGSDYICVSLWIGSSQKVTQNSGGTFFFNQLPFPNIYSLDLHLLSGLLQQVTLSVSVESGSIAAGSVLEISSKNHGLTFEPVQSGQAIVNCLMGKEESKTAPYSVEVNMIPEGDDVTGISFAMVTLPALGPYAKIDFDLKLRASLEKQSIQEEITEHKVWTALE